MNRPQHSPLADPSWRYVDKDCLDAFDTADWALITAQRDSYMKAQQSAQVLRLLTASRDDPGFGYAINNYRHCLQSATMAMQAGCDEETIVVALLHDVGFIVCPHTHGDFAAELLGPYVSEANEWMLRHHACFQEHHVHGCPGVEREARERWRGHPHFEWTARFVDRFDQRAISASFVESPIETFEPMVARLFARPPNLRGERA